MTTVRQLLALTLVAFTVGSGSALADQQHIVSQGQVSAAIADRAAAQDADRAAIREALGRDEVRRVAVSMGLDLNRANDAVATMNGTDLAQAAAAARDVNQQLVGGAS